MGTKRPLYPGGFVLTRRDLATLKDDTHPTVMPVRTAMRNYWKPCQATAVVTVTLHNFPTAGETRAIGTSMVGQRLAKSGVVIPRDKPRRLTGSKHARPYTEDFASPMDFPGGLVSGQEFGPDNFYEGRHTFRGVMYFNRTEALPAVECNYVVTSSNGAIFKLGVGPPDPSFPPAQTKVGDFLVIDGQAIRVFFTWDGAALFGVDPEMSVVVTTDEAFTWT